MANDYVDQMLRDFDSEDGTGWTELEEQISGLERVGGLTEVGADAVRAAASASPAVRARLVQQLKNAKAKQQAKIGRGKPSPPFARSQRETERRAPLGFIEDGTGAFFFTLAAVIGATTTMRAKVSRAAHVDRLLIVPSAPGAVIQSVFVGDEEQILAAGAPVELYGPSALTDTIPDNFSPLEPALDFIVVLRNTTAGAITGTIGVKASVQR